MSPNLLEGSRESGHPCGRGKVRVRLASFFLCMHACASHEGQSWALILSSFPFESYVSDLVVIFFSLWAPARGGGHWARAIHGPCGNVAVQQAGNPKSRREQSLLSSARKWQAWPQPLALNTDKSLTPGLVSNHAQD